MDTKTMVVAILAIVAAFTLLISPVACTVNRHRLISDAIKGGADPIAIKCALEGSGGPIEPVCLLKATGK